MLRLFSCQLWPLAPRGLLLMKLLVSLAELTEREMKLFPVSLGQISERWNADLHEAQADLAFVSPTWPQSWKNITQNYSKPGHVG